MKRILTTLAVIFCVVIIYGQAVSRTISGVVTDEQGSVLPGVSVLEDGTRNGCITNIDGKYSIQVQSEKSVLVFSFIGMVTVKEQVKNRSVINVRLKSDAVSMDEVVVTNYGGRREKKSIAYSKALQGRTPGVMIRGNAGYVPAYDMAPFNTEGYSTVHENGYRDVTNEPLSTFSVDVDRASYTNVRRFINNGQLPPVDAVRIEEMINYFNYDYDTPKGDDPFAVNSDLAICPWNEEHYLLKVGLKGQEIEKDNLPPSNLVFLLDVSGSMNAPNKLPLLKSSLRLLVNELRAEDHVSIVVYAGAAGVVLKPTPGNEKKIILDALDRLQAGGSTAGGEGLRLAYATAKEHFVKGGNNRILLATDGDFNVGVSSNADMERLVEKERNNGIFVTVLGFGMGNYKDDKMEIIADKGNGNYAYIDNLQEAQKTLVSEFGGTLFTIAKDVKFQIEFNPQKVLAYRLIGYENRLLNNEDFNDDTKDAGEIGAGHTVTALYEIIPVGAKDAGEWLKSVDALKYQKRHKNVSATNANEWLTLKLRYKQPDRQQSQLMEFVVKGEVDSFEEASDDLRFAASVAGFGMLLRDSKYKGKTSFEAVRSWAKNSRGKDDDGFKAEMIRLVKTAETLHKQTASMD